MPDIALADVSLTALTGKENARSAVVSWPSCVIICANEERAIEVR